MNNRYIFRGKRKSDGEWVEGYLYITHNGEYEISRYDDELDTERITYIVIPETVGQCTGLKDKNGKLIFEGDILHIKTGKGWSCPIGTDIYYKVVFTEFNIECYSCTEYIGFMAERSNNCLSSIYYAVTNCGAEVIGNEFDNPELLEVER